MRRRLGAGRSAGRGGGLTHAAWQVITSKCFTKCVTRPGPKLDDSEKICTAKCMDRRVSPVGVDAAQPSRAPARWVRRYLDAMAIVSQTWASRAKAQAQMGGGGDGGFLG